MHEYGFLIASVLVYVIGQLIVKSLTGIKPTPSDWRFWVYDTPATASGILLGIFYAKHFLQ